MSLRTPGDFPVYLIRHGETQFNTERRYQGSRDDSPLTALGRKQAREVGSILADLVARDAPPDFVSSPLGRARKTTEIVLEVLGLPPDRYTTDTRLMEIDLGEWSGWYDRDVEVNDRDRWEARQRDKWTVPPPGGESYAMVAERAADWFRGLTKETAAISHGAFGRILRGLYGGLTWEQMSEMDEPQGVVFRLQAGGIARIEPPLLVDPCLTANSGKQ